MKRALAVALLLTATACSGGGKNVATGSTTAAPTTTAVPAIAATALPTTTTTATSSVPSPSGWASTGLKAVSGILADGGAVVAVDGTKPALQAVVLDAATGKERFRAPWSVSSRFGGMGVGLPAVTGGMLVATENKGAQTDLVGLDLADGAEKWRTTIVGTFGPYACGSLVCADETDGGDTGSLVARDPQTGKQVWARPGVLDVQDTGAGGVLVLELGTPVLILVDPATGASRWERDLTPVIGKGVDTGGGWAFLHVGTRYVGYIGDTGEDGGPGGGVGIDAATGAVQWERANVQLCPLDLGDVALSCPADGGLARIDPTTGKDVWSAAGIGAFPDGPGPWLGVTPDEQKVTATKSGAPVVVDVGTGAVSARAPAALVWNIVVSDLKVDTPLDGQESYSGDLGLVPTAPDALKGSDVPPHVGKTVSGLRIFVDATGTIRAITA